MIISKRRYNKMKKKLERELTLARVEIKTKEDGINRIVEKYMNVGMDLEDKIINLNIELKKEKEFNNYLLEAIRILEDRVRQEMIRNFKYID